MSWDASILKSSNWFTGETEEFVKRLINNFNSGRSVYIVTANIECIAYCKNDDEFESICFNADYLIPDGIGAVVLLRRYNHSVSERIPGIELAQKVLSEVPPRTRLFLFGGKEYVVKKTNEFIKDNYPNIDIAGICSGYKFDTRTIINDVNESKADILFVALGMPKQEKWIADNLDRLNVKLAIGVGGSFDVWSGTTKRAPGWMKMSGLEWLWRIGLQPFSRVPRFLKSVFLFLQLYFSRR